jgi:hypothetical protein
VFRCSALKKLTSSSLYVPSRETVVPAMNIATRAFDGCNRQFLRPDSRCIIGNQISSRFILLLIASRGQDTCNKVSALGASVLAYSVLKKKSVSKGVWENELRLAD